MLERGGIRRKENSFQSLMEFGYQIQKKEKSLLNEKLHINAFLFLNTSS